MTRSNLLAFANIALAATPIMAIAIAAYSNTLPLF
jgi:hypothetical protein